MDVIQYIKCVLDSRMYLACRCVSLVHELGLFALVRASKTSAWKSAVPPMTNKVKNTFCNITEKLNKSLWKSAQVEVPDRNERVL